MNDLIILNSRAYDKYEVTDSEGKVHFVYGHLHIAGDFVIVGDNAIFHRPVSVIPV
jgi:hypothetical protein